MDYTLRFLEDFVIKEVDSEFPQSTKHFAVIESIADRFLETHGTDYEKYLQDMEEVIKREYKEVVDSLETESTKIRLKKQFIEAIDHYGIKIAEDVKQKLSTIEINFNYRGGSTTANDTSSIDILQCYKLSVDFPDKYFPLKPLIIGMIYHELGHVLNSLTCEDAAEPFAQGFSKLVLEYAGLENKLDDYYQAKKEEIYTLGELRVGISRVLVNMSKKSRKMGLNKINGRALAMTWIYTSHKLRSIEAYSSPLSLEEIKKRINQ